MKILIGCVLYIENVRQYDIAIDSLNTFTSREHQLDKIAVVNKCEYGEEVITKKFKKVLRNNRNCLAKAWNMIIEEGKSYDYVLIPNLDVYCNDNTIDNLISFAEKHKDAIIWSSYCVNGLKFEANIHQYFEVSHINMFDNGSFYLTSYKALEKLRKYEQNTLEDFKGRFDENIPVYAEDVDMQYRIELAGYKHLCTKTSTFIHLRNVTIRMGNDPKLNELELNESKSMPYMVAKWGGIRQNSIFKRPFESYATKI